MAKVFAGRFTAQTDEPFVVFIIGMRVNKLLAVNKWVPVALAMGPMLKTLYQNPEKGFLGGQSFVYGRGVAIVQYWRSFEDLEKFARDPSDAHLPSWQAFNKAVGSNGSVGIFHETYMVEPGKYKSVYGKMPKFGLAKATNHVPAVGKRETARRRMGGDNEPAVESSTTSEIKK
jgi:hypothetical protein